eukprot:472903-Hanusia_phi.AAC.1
MEEGFVRGAVCDQAGAVYVAGQMMNASSDHQGYLMKIDCLGATSWGRALPLAKSMSMIGNVLDGGGNVWVFANV